MASLLDNVRGDPVRLELFLRSFPKGADLHNHLSGAVYAESFLKWAGEDGLCVSLAEKTILSRPCPKPAEGQENAEALSAQPEAWNAMINALSMRNFVPTETDRSGHDHFFATFLRFTAAEREHQGDMLAEAMSKAASDHVQYVEFQIAPIPFASLAEMLEHTHLQSVQNKQDFQVLYEGLQPFFSQILAQAQTAIDEMEWRAHSVLKCGTKQAASACNVAVRYQYSALRVFPAPFVFTQLVAAYELTHRDPRVVGVNLVAPEDNPTALHDYDLHMQMFHYLNQRYPGTNVSLHAGEITPALVPAADMDHHIHAAIEVAGVKRVGHGVDVQWEHDPEILLQDMAKRHILVEINLTSNDEILGIKGADHPFLLYRRAGVPVALSTDDEGVSRSDLTQEYKRAVEAYHLTYDDLIELSRAGLEYGFMPGASLWADHKLGQVVTVCSGDVAHIGTTTPTAACQHFLNDNMKARLQWQLERAFSKFEQDMSHNVLLGER